MASGPRGFRIEREGIHGVVLRNTAWADASPGARAGFLPQESYFATRHRKGACEFGETLENVGRLPSEYHGHVQCVAGQEHTAWGLSFWIAENLDVDRQ
jgi:hypothetical protein